MSGRRKPVLLVALVITGVGLLVLPAYSHLFNYTQPQGGGSLVRDRWDFNAFPVQWNLNNSPPGPNISGSRPLSEVVTESFATWIAAPNALLQVTRGADTLATAVDNNSSENLICFICNHDIFEGSGTLAVGITLAADAAGLDDFHGGKTSFPGQIVKAAILFNPDVEFSTDQGDGENVQDLQAVATHEIGHFFGLAHSAVVRAIMYRSASDMHTLSYDDVAALSVTYPTNQQVPTGSISGNVRLSGAPIFGAHVFAESTTDAHPFAAQFPDIRKTPVGILTQPDGSYRIDGLPPDSYLIVAEPLDGPVTNDDVQLYAPAFGQAEVQKNFNTRWH